VRNPKYSKFLFFETPVIALAMIFLRKNNRVEKQQALRENYSFREMIISP
jgi:hypothetical protein